MDGSATLDVCYEAYFPFLPLPLPTLFFSAPSGVAQRGLPLKFIQDPPLFPSTSFPHNPSSSHCIRSSLEPEEALGAGFAPALPPLTSLFCSWLQRVLP